MAASIILLKTEPESPSSNYDDASSVTEDTTFYWTSLDENNLETELSDITESKAQVAAELLESLERLEDLDDLIKEEPFGNWMEDKIMVPIYQEHPKIIKSSPDTQSLLQEFENVFDCVELNHCALTPPQSPPYATPILTSLVPMPSAEIKAYNYTQLPTNNKIFVDNNQQYVPQLSPPSAQDLESPDFKRIFIENSNYGEQMSPSSPQSDVDRELAAVEELVRARAENFMPTSPSSGSSSDDPDWSPDERSMSTDSHLAQKRSRCRSRPYSTGNEDRKNRKKEQNKNAATRYRLKKKAEVEEILSEERQLQKENENLENKISDVQREIKYIKGLMRDLFKAKGLLQ